MAIGSAWTPEASTGLWHLNYKINGNHGFNMKFHVAQKNEIDCKVIANRIGAYMLALLPVDCEVFYATMSKDDHKKDSRYLPDSVGKGLFVSAGTTPPAAAVDFDKTALLFRMEHADGGSVTRKWSCLPDEIVRGNVLLPVIDPVVGTPGADPAAPAGVQAFEVVFLAFMKYVVRNTHHVKAGHAPGGVYDYFAWQNCYPMRIGSKKGGRDFI